MPRRKRKTRKSGPPSLLLVGVRYVGKYAGREIFRAAFGRDTLKILAGGDVVVLPEWEAEELVAKYEDLELVEEGRR